jgi:type I restriction enzyme M protein
MSKKKNTVKEVTTAQRLSSIVKSCRDIMRKDRGLNGDSDRLPLLTWLMFLKFLDDMEVMQETEAQLAQKKYKPLIKEPYRWRDWAKNINLTGDDLIQFVNTEEIPIPKKEDDKTEQTPDKKKETMSGLLYYLRQLQSNNGGDRRDVIATVFRGVTNRMVSGYLLRDVVNKIDEIHFTSNDEIFTLSHLYESLLKEMRDSAGDAGEFYTPRPVVKFIVEIMKPQIGEKMLDPACGTGGFLVEAFDYMKKQATSKETFKILQETSIYGGEAKPLPFLLSQMNLLLHGLEFPQISFGNSLSKKLSDISDSERVDIIMTNPPFGGEEERGILKNFPDEKQTAETALLFMQLIMRKLKKQTPIQKGGRAAVVVPNGVLFGDGISARIKEQLTKDFNLHTIVRLPDGIFAPYTSIPTNLLFFTAGEPTKDIWYYQIKIKDGRKNYTKTNPIQFEEFEEVITWWNNRTETENAWKIDFATLLSETDAKAEVHRKIAKESETKIAKNKEKIDTLEKEIQASDKEKDKKTAEINNLKTKNEDLKKIATAEKNTAETIYYSAFNLDFKNPAQNVEILHLEPEVLLQNVIDKETKILNLLNELKTEFN